MRSIHSRLAPPKRGEVAIRTTWVHAGGDSVRVIRGRSSAWQIEELREAFPDCCEACVGITLIERCEQWKCAGWSLIRGSLSPRLREWDGVLCRHCITRIADDMATRIKERLENLGCRVEIKIRFPKRGTIENYMERFSSRKCEVRA